MAIEQQLAACANVFPMQSVFPWNGEIQQEEEFVLILKTLPSLAITTSLLSGGEALL
jgi:uncharacterized protein involved in tolerance to divalent cations